MYIGRIDRSIAISKFAILSIFSSIFLKISKKQFFQTSKNGLRSFKFDIFHENTIPSDYTDVQESISTNIEAQNVTFEFLNSARILTLAEKTEKRGFFWGISSQSTGNGDTTMIFGFLEECRMKKLFLKTFWIFLIFSLLCGAKKSKNLRFGRKNGETGFFGGCQNQEKCQKSKFLFFCTTSF